MGECGTPVAVSVATAEPVSAAAEGGETGENVGSAGEACAGGKPEIFDTPETVAVILRRLDRIIETQERMIRLLTPEAEDSCGKEGPENGADKKAHSYAG